MTKLTLTLKKIKGIFETKVTIPIIYNCNKVVKYANIKSTNLCFSFKILKVNFFFEYEVNYFRLHKLLQRNLIYYDSLLLLIKLSFLSEPS